MNKIYKTKWSTSLQQYVVTDEKTATKTKSSKSTVALAVASILALGAGFATASTPTDVYEETGIRSSVNFDQSKTWESEEYNKNWGLHAFHASHAYSLGFYGQGVKLGVMDSGAHLDVNPDLTGEQFHSVSYEGKYGQSGKRYPQHVKEEEDKGEYKEGDSFKFDGKFTLNVNDSHGTQVTGSMGASRNGHGMHGVSWGSEMYVANTGGTDDTNYGPFLDYNQFKAGYDALVKEGVKIINNSFGTNLKQLKPDGTVEDYYVSGPELRNVKEVEYEYFMFKRMYGEKKSFVDAAWDAIKGKDTIQVFTNGNNQRENPYHRALYPYFHPEAEAQWIAIAGLKQTKEDPTQYMIETNFNEAGLAKFWTITGPGQNGYTTKVDPKTGNLAPAQGIYEEGYGSFSGTSMAAPFVSGAFGVLASRYPDMKATQVRDVLFTTANHKNSDGTDMEGWANVDGSTPLDGQVSDRMGWGIPDLRKGMYGPGQFLGEFDYNLTKLDVWTNDITNVALDQREKEDLAWIKDVSSDGTINGKAQADKGGDYKLDNDKEFAGITHEQKQVSQDEARKWRQEYFDKRFESIKNKVEKGLYKGSLIKSGDGTLVMTGNNSYKGTTTVKRGTLLAFAESIGTDKTVTVENGGTIGILASYLDDTLTMTGMHFSNATQNGELTINIKEGGTLYVPAGADIKVKEVKLDAANTSLKIGIEGTSGEALITAYNSGTATGTFEVQNGSLSNLSNTPKVNEENYLFFEVGNTTVEGNKVITTINRKKGSSISDYALTSAEKEIAFALEHSTSALAGELLLAKDDKAIKNTFSIFTDDMYASARNALVVDSLTLTNTVTEQARGIGEGRHAEFDGGRGRVWSVAVGSWGTADGETNSADVDFTAGLFGAELNVCPATKLGAYIGMGSTNVYGKNGKIDGQDRHYGIYGLTDFMGASFTYGVGYTTQDRDSGHLLGNTENIHSEDASVLQVFAEASYKFNLGLATIDPYVGFNWARVNVDGFTEKHGDKDIAYDEIKDDIQVSTLGARFTLPFEVASQTVVLKANAGWSHYFGDTEANQKILLGSGSPWANVYAKELKDQFNLGLGLEAQLDKRANLGISYVGSFGTDTDMNGAMLNFNMKF